MSTDAFRLQYLARTAAGVPRDLANTLVVSKIKPIRPTVLIYNCTFVCDARCTMCNNWKRGNRKEDMPLDQVDGVFDHEFWGAVENLNISGGEPTTRNDLPEMVEMFQRRLRRLRKIGINTTGLTPHRAIPMLTRIVEFCAEHDLLISIRVSLDGIGDIHNQVRNVKRGFDKASQTIEAMQTLAGKHPQFQFGIASTIFATNLEDAKNILAWARSHKLDVVFNMLRFTDNMLGNRSLEESIGFREREEEFMRQFFLERVQEESVLSGQAFMYLHYADMIANGYIRTMPCPFRTQGLLLNPNGDLFYCENSDLLGNVLDTNAVRHLFQGRESRPSRDVRRDHLQALPQPVPGERRRDEAVRAVREVPDARVSGQEQPRAARRDPSDRAVTRLVRSRAVRLVVAAGLTGYLLWISHPEQIGRATAGAAPSWLLAACALVLVDRTLMAWRWIALLRPLTADAPPRLADVIRVFFVSTFVGTFLPASVGGDAVRAFSLSRHNVPAAPAVASVVMDRALGVVSILSARPVQPRRPARGGAAWRLRRSRAGRSGVVGGGAGDLLGRRRGPRGACDRRWCRENACGASDRACLTRSGRTDTIMAFSPPCLVYSVVVQVIRVLQAWCLGLRTAHRGADRRCTSSRFR